MTKKIVAPLIVALVLASAYLAQAQQAKLYRVGAILEGGPFYAVIDGLKDRSGLDCAADDLKIHFQS